jgi:hypothetical protein
MGERACVHDDLDTLVKAIVTAAPARRPHPGHEQWRLRRHSQQTIGKARQMNRRDFITLTLRLRPDWLAAGQTHAALQQYRFDSRQHVPDANLLDGVVDRAIWKNSAAKC